MEPDGCTVWSIIGLRKYVLHLLRVWFGRKATDTLLVTDAFLSRKDWTASASSSYPLESPSFSVQSLSVMLDSPEPLLDSELGGMTHSLARCGQSFGCRKPCEPTKQHTHTQTHSRLDNCCSFGLPRYGASNSLRHTNI